MEEQIFDEIDKEISNEWAEEQQKYGIVVIPYEIVTGFIGNTEEGQIEIQNISSPTNYSQFEQVFLGKDAINVIWKNAKPWYKIPHVNRATFIDRIGDYYMGKIISGQSHSSIVNGEEAQVEEEKTRYVSDTYSIRFDFPESTLNKNVAELENKINKKHYFFPKEEDKYCLYMIPELAGNKLFQLVDISYHTASDGNGICAVECSFQTIENTFKKTGYAVEQFIHFAAPGDPYTLPVVLLNDDGTKYISHKQIEAKPITHIQIECFGPAAISGISVLGRKLNITHNENGDNNYAFNQWQFLFPYSLFQPQQSLLAKCSSPSKNYFFFPQSTLSLNYSKTLFEIYKAQYNSIAENDYSGILMTNSDNQNDWDSIETGLHKSNKLVNGIWKDYYDETWKPTAFLSNQPSFNCEGNMYCDNTLNYTNDMTCVDILAMNGIMYYNQLELPLSFRNSKPYRLSNLPLIGGMFSAFLGDRVLFPNTKSIVPMKMGLFMDATIAGALHALKLDNSWAGIFLDSLGDKEKTNWTAGGPACNTSFCFNLTNKIELDGLEYDTKYLGQNKDENGDDILDGGETLLFNDSFELLEPDSDGFSIDKIIIFGLFKGTIHINYYSYPNNGFIPVYQTTILSNTGFTNSYRNWATIITTGGIVDKMLDSVDSFTYPNAPSKSGNGVALNYSRTFNFKIDIEHNTPNMNPYFDLSGSQGNKAVWYNAIDSLSFSTIIEYSHLGINGVSDRTSFLNWYKNSNKKLQVDVSGSYYNIKSDTANYNQTKYPSFQVQTLNLPQTISNNTITKDFNNLSLPNEPSITTSKFLCVEWGGVGGSSPCWLDFFTHLTLELEAYNIRITISPWITIYTLELTPEIISWLSLATTSKYSSYFADRDEYHRREQTTVFKVNSIKFL